MKLSELFPVEPKITLAGKDYALIYNTRAVLRLEREYPDITVEGKTVETPQRINKVIESMLTGVKASDLINVMHAMLATEIPSKDDLIDILDLKKFDEYCSAAFVAITNARLTEEQIEKLEVLASQAKKKAQDAIIAQNTASIDASADSAEKNTLTPPSAN